MKIFLLAIGCCLYTLVLFGQAPANDLCFDAQVITGSGTYPGTTTGSTGPGVTTGCNNINNSGGVWYRVRSATDKQIVARIDVSSPTELNVLALLEGADCSSLSCSQVVDEDQTLINYSLLAWEAEAGEEYYLYVTSDGFSVEGDFVLVLEYLDLQVNDVCSGARVVTEGSYSASFKGATYDYDDNFCSDSYDSEGPGIWYAFTPSASGNYFAAVNSLYGLQEKQVTVYSGPSCSDLACINGQSYNGIQYYDAVVTWDAVGGETYYILAHDAQGRGYGNFIFEIGENAVATNDGCATATAISPGTYVGNTATSTPTTGVNCSEVGEGNDVWYSFVAPADGEYYISTYGFNSNFDTQLFVLSGSCGNLDCLDDNDDFGDNYFSRIDFTAQANVTYYFVVNPYNSDVSGRFEFNLVAAEPAANDQCATATDILYNSRVVGSTFGATPSDELDDCGDADDEDAPDVWYRFSPTTSGTAVASTFSSLTDYYTALTVYSGPDCANLTCVAGNTGSDIYDNSFDDQTELSFEYTAGTTYYIVVHGQDDDEEGYGRYELYLGNPIDRNAPQVPRVTNFMVFNQTLGLAYASITAAIEGADDNRKNVLYIVTGTYPESVDFGGKEIEIRVGAVGL